MMRSWILLVEDEPGLRRTLKDLLVNAGYNVDTSADGAEAQSLAERQPYDLILLDVMLPSRSGFDVAKNLRNADVETPILMLTARTELHNKVQGFKFGADDYLTKPFEAPELLVRVEALLRRAQTGTRKRINVWEFRDISVDFTKARLNRKGQVIMLSERECRLLRHLIESRGEVVTRDELLEEVWGYNAAPATRTVDVHISWLRQKLEDDPTNPQFIVTVHGQGYRFVQ
jgi:two-component system, OmpR family, alkaline phosphatase synthesis response regulator PhoP